NLIKLGGRVRRLRRVLFQFFNALFKVLNLLICSVQQARQVFNLTFKVRFHRVHGLVVNRIPVLSGVRDARNLIVTHVQGSGHGIPCLFHIRQRSRAVFKARDFGIHIRLGSGTCVSSRSFHSQVRASKVVRTSNGVAGVLDVRKGGRPVFDACHVLGRLICGGFSCLCSFLGSLGGLCCCADLRILCSLRFLKCCHILFQLTDIRGNGSGRILDSIIDILFAYCISGACLPFNVLNLIAAHIQCTSHGVPRLLDIRQGGGSVRQTADSLVNILFRRGVGVVHRLADSSSSADRDIFNSQSASSISVHLLHI